MTLLPRTLEARTAVYRLFDREGHLLYVGIAINPEARLAVHAREKGWWADVDQDKAQVTWFSNRAAAIAEENAAIEAEDPRYNVTGSMNPPVPRQMREPRSYDDLRPIRIAKETWNGYAEVVGNKGRSSDLKAYINWRIDNPTTPLPGRRRGPVKKAGPSKPAEE